jgi:hypothetical protein
LLGLYFELLPFGLYFLFFEIIDPFSCFLGAGQVHLLLTGLLISGQKLDHLTNTFGLLPQVD